jgi:hypothetical protein
MLPFGEVLGQVETSEKSTMSAGTMIKHHYMHFYRFFVLLRANVLL